MKLKYTFFIFSLVVFNSSATIENKKVVKNVSILIPNFEEGSHMLSKKIPLIGKENDSSGLGLII